MNREKIADQLNKSVIQHDVKFLGIAIAYILLSEALFIMQLISAIYAKPGNIMKLISGVLKRSFNTTVNHSGE